MDRAFAWVDSTVAAGRDRIGGDLEPQRPGERRARFQPGGDRRHYSVEPQGAGPGKQLTVDGRVLSEHEEHPLVVESAPSGSA